jgi:hypothetical protein
MFATKSSTVQRAKLRFDWREGLLHSRDVPARDVDAYGFALSWHEEWRVKCHLDPSRQSAGQLEVGKTAKACSRFGHERKARWAVGPKARAVRLSQHGRLSHTKARRHEGEGCWMLNVGCAWDAIGRGLALGKTPPRRGNGSNFEGLGGEDASATGDTLPPLVDCRFFRQNLRLRRRGLTELVLC